MAHRMWSSGELTVRRTLLVPTLLVFGALILAAVERKQMTDVIAVERKQMTDERKQMTDAIAVERKQMTDAEVRATKAEVRAAKAEAATEATRKVAKVESAAAIKLARAKAKAAPDEATKSVKFLQSAIEFFTQSLAQRPDTRPEDNETFVAIANSLSWREITTAGALESLSRMVEGGAQTLADNE
eukprot:2169100-Prymnesium_polylepis.2